VKVGGASATRVIRLATKLAAIHLANCTRFAMASLDEHPEWLSFRLGVPPLIAYRLHNS